MNRALTKLLSDIDTPGTFATRMRASTDGLLIDVTGVGPLKFPITPRLAQKLRSVGQPSPFGLGEETLHDPAVRSSWEVAKSRVKIAARPWKRLLASYVQTLQAELGFTDDCELEAVFDKLLIYEEGQFFKPHQDSEKADGMLGSLVVILPSVYSGGIVTVEHRGQKKTFRRVVSQATELSLLAFYADCHHAVSPIKGGVRVALSYQLRLRNHSGTAPINIGTERLEDLSVAFKAYFSTPISKRYSRSESAAPERFVYLLDHEYSQRSLNWTQLKNGDRARVAALASVAERLDYAFYLALAEVQENWLCEEDGWGGRYRRHRWGFDDDEQESESESEEYTLIELQESSVVLSHWLDRAGHSVHGIPGIVDEDELHFTKPSRDFDPFQSEYEGYQGNYGSTLDRWYHRAAFVMWPQTNTFALRAQVSPEWAVNELLALPRTATTEIEKRVSALLPRWEETADSVKSVTFFANILTLAKALGSATLAHRWLVPVGLHRLTNKTMRGALATLVDKHGLEWATGLVVEWTKGHRFGTPGWAPLLADLCGELHATRSKACKSLASWLLAREVKVVQKRCADALKRQPPWLDLESFGDETKYLADVFAAATALSAYSVVTNSMETLLDVEPEPPRSFPVQLLLACAAQGPALKTLVAHSALPQLWIARLRQLLRAPKREASDWAITWQPACSCVDCDLLTGFLASPRKALDWPLNKNRRRHIHDTIDAGQLPVLHSTLHRGSPHVLQLRKDPSLFSREDTYRIRLKEILATLSTNGLR